MSDIAPARRSRSGRYAAAVLVIAVAALILLIGPFLDQRASAPPIQATVHATAVPANIYGYPLLRGTGGRPVRLMVQEGTYYMQQRALNETDNKTLSWIWSTYEYLDVPDGTPVGIVKQGGDDGTISGTTTQVHVLLGEYTGRRGWVSSIYLKP